MKKILLVTALLTITTATISFLEVNKYDKNKKVAEKEKEVAKIKQEIIEMDKKIENANETLKEISNDDNEKVELLKLWQKQLEKLQKNI